jgi:hypothetical protein
MSSLYLDAQILVGGVATDADSTPTLTDETATFGAKRLDTNGIVVAAGTAYTRTAAGTYQYILSDAVAGVTYEYWIKATIGGVDYYLRKTKTAAEDAATDSYLSVSDADALAATLTGLASYTAASSGAKLNALAEASGRIDTAMRYQGRKYDPAQVLEFPRVPYESSLIGRQTWPPYPDSRAVPDVVWDWDSTANAAVVPARVKRACLIEADSILAGTRDDRLDAQHDGLASQSVGPHAESYRPPASGGVGGAASSLCRRAYELMQPYRLVSGQLR